MKQINDEVIGFLSDMALRKKDQSVPIDRLGVYVSFLNHVSGKDRLSVDRLSSIIKYVEDDAFVKHPALREELEACHNLVKLTGS